MSGAVDRLNRVAELSTLPPAHLAALTARATWRKQARPGQFSPAVKPTGPWGIWFLNCGRGWGKTRTEVEWGWWKAWRSPNSIVNVVGRTYDDVERVLFGGPAGFFNVIPPEIIAYTKRGPFEVGLTNGSVIQGYSAEKPAALRGPQCHFAVCDEVAHWAKAEEALDNLFFGLRLQTSNGLPSAQAMLGTTPLPRAHIRAFLKRAQDPNDRVALSTGSTYENIANLEGAFFELVKKYEGTRLGQQELLGNLLEDVEGALWTLARIEESRGPVRIPSRVVVGVDPPAATAECGIVVVQRDVGKDPVTGCVLADRSLAGSPDAWGRAVVKAHDDYEADAVVVEVNQGGAMVAHTVRTAAQAMHSEGTRPTREIKIIEVRAAKGKVARAEPISALYEQGRIRHVEPFPALESQMTTWSPLLGEASPDRMDALVWALTEAILLAKPTPSAPLPRGFGARAAPARIR